MSNIRALRMILHEGAQKKYSRKFRQVSEKFNRFYFNQGGSNTKLDGYIN